VPVTTVTNFKGGVGKSFLVQLLAAACAMVGRRVLVCDMDPQANLTRRMKISAAEMANRLSMAEVLRDIDTNPELIRQVILPSQWEEDFAERIDIVPSRKELAYYAEGGAGSWLRLQEALSAVKGEYDDILIDTPPGLGGLVQNALVASEHVLLVTWPEADSINGVKRVLDFMAAPKEGKAIGVTATASGVVVNFRHSSAKTHKERIAEINRVWGDLVWQPPIPQTIRIQEATSEFAEPPQNASPEIASVARMIGEAYLKAVA
jgi:chromosome partitioning protein